MTDHYFDLLKENGSLKQENELLKKLNQELSATMNSIRNALDKGDTLDKLQQLLGK